MEPMERGHAAPPRAVVWRNWEMQGERGGARLPPLLGRHLQLVGGLAGRLGRQEWGRAARDRALLMQTWSAVTT